MLVLPPISSVLPDQDVSSQRLGYGPQIAEHVVIFPHVVLESAYARSSLGQRPG